ncbi:MAG: aryl-sulfate sulfotransferase [Candidatus Thermoplasmatota archaeon]
MVEQEVGTIDGQILFSPYYTTTTYLINSSGAVNHTWSSAYKPFTSAYWLGNGTILRPISSGGGGVQKILWDGTIAWDFRYNVAGCTCHHDIRYLPNGNVVMIVWETKTRDQAIAAGRNPSTIDGNTFTSDKIIEVKPTGPTSGEIVWEWRVWDHLIQDYDPSKANYGVVGNHPELIDINFGDTFVYDWLHTNSIDYHPQFDQLLIDIHNFNEVWVIDHSTTTQEAAGHTGGNSGKGGDLLYRWGNPQAYNAGTANDQQLFFQHDASWIKPGYPGEGHILVFNNGNDRPGGPYSSVDEFAPPVNSNGEYFLAPGSAYGPEHVTWRYTANPPGTFYSQVFGGALRLKDGNTLICDGVSGRFFEVTPENTIVWQYINPYPNPTYNDVFKIDYLPPEEPPQTTIPDLDCSGSLSWSDVKPGATVRGSFQVQNVGMAGSLLNWTVDHSSPSWGTWTFTPESGDNLTPEQGPVIVQVSVVVPNQKNTQFQGSLRIQNENNASDYDTIPVTLKTPTRSILTTDIPLYHLMRLWHSFLTNFLEDGTTDTSTYLRILTVCQRLTVKSI